MKQIFLIEALRPKREPQTTTTTEEASLHSLNKKRKKKRTCHSDFAVDKYIGRRPSGFGQRTNEQQRISFLAEKAVAGSSRPDAQRYSLGTHESRRRHRPKRRCQSYTSGAGTPIFLRARVSS